jgi:hypothetical protein
MNCSKALGWARAEKPLRDNNHPAAAKAITSRKIVIVASRRKRMPPSLSEALASFPGGGNGGKLSICYHSVQINALTANGLNFNDKTMDE